MSERQPYSRVYWSIIDDPKFATIYDNDHHLAAWLRLLLTHDQAHPSSGHVPAVIQRASLRALCDAGLIDVTGRRFRVHGLDAERERRRIAATTRGPNGTRTGTGRYPDGGPTVPVRSVGLGLGRGLEGKRGAKPLDARDPDGPVDPR